MDPGKITLLTDADFVLSKCGRPVPPVGSVVYLYKGFLVQGVLPVAQGQTYYKEVVGDTTWCWRSISVALSGNPPAVGAQVTTPEGRVLFNGILDLTLIAGYGSNRYALSREIECPPGTKIQLTLDDNYYNAAVQQAVSMLLGGAYAYYLKDGLRSVDRSESAALLPRIFGEQFQNPLSPCWMLGEGPQTPPGFDDVGFIYGTGTTNLATITVGSSLSTRATIPIDNDADFEVYRFLFDVLPDDTLTAGTLLVRIRSGSGYVFTDDYIDVAKYLGSAYLLKPWFVRRGDAIQFDIFLADAAGTGSITIECFADGVRRKVAA